MQDGVSMGAGWNLSGCRMESHWVQDGVSMGSGWILNGCLNGCSMESVLPPSGIISFYSKNFLWRITAIDVLHCAKDLISEAAAVDATSPQHATHHSSDLSSVSR